MTDAERVKEKVDIVDIVSEYVPLKKAGRNFKGLSPFRTEKTPSFIVSPDRQIFRDFGGDKGGDAITFIMEIENITFQEALKYLADKAGIKLTQNAPTTQEEKDRDTIFAINHLTQLFYTYILTSHKAGKEALTYITEKRKLPLELVQNFGIGYAPDATSLTRYLTKKKGYTTAQLEYAGVAANYNGRVIDFFRNRLIFPIQDVRGNVVAFSGRALDNIAQPKYINTRETKVYKKSESLYGLFQAKDDIRREKKVIVVEGELDVLSPRKEGIQNIVAAKGTALTEEHIKLLKRYAEKIIFCFDQDPAGTEAQRRALELMEKHGLTSAVITLEGGKDPDELVNENPVEFKKAIKNEINTYDFIIDSAVKQFGTTTSDAKKKILEKVIPPLSHIENEVIKEHYMKRLAEALDTTLTSISKEVDKKALPAKQTEKTSHKKESLEEHLTACVLQSNDIPKTAKLAVEELKNVPLTNPGIQKLLTFLTSCTSNEEVTKKLPKELSNLYDEAHLRPIHEFPTQIELENEVKKSAQRAKKAAAKKRMDEIATELKETKDEKKEEELAKEYTKLSEVLK